MSFRVLIATGQEVVRSAFARTFSAEPDMEVVAECADGTEALEAVRRLRPQVAVLDLDMPHPDGLEVARELRAQSNDMLTPAVVTISDFDENVYTALRDGAVGFLLTTVSPKLLVETVRAAAAGESVISVGRAFRLLPQHLAALSQPPSRGAIDPLTPREIEIVRLVARGLTNQEVAEELFVSLSTIKTHLGNIQGKLGARNRVEIATWALMGSTGMR